MGDNHALVQVLQVEAEVQWNRLWMAKKPIRDHSISEEDEKRLWKNLEMMKKELFFGKGGRKIREKEVRPDRIPKNEKLCKVKRCFKEVNPDDPKMRGYYIGKPFVYEEKAFACYLCRREQ